MDLFNQELTNFQQTSTFSFQTGSLSLYCNLQTSLMCMKNIDHNVISMNKSPNFHLSLFSNGEWNVHHWTHHFTPTQLVWRNQWMSKSAFHKCSLQTISSKHHLTHPIIVWTAVGHVQAYLGTMALVVTKTFFDTQFVISRVEAIAKSIVPKHHGITTCRCKIWHITFPSTRVTHSWSHPWGPLSI